METYQMVLLGVGTLLVILFLSFMYEHAYDTPLMYDGTVTNMDYTPSRTSYNAATKSITTSPEIHKVYITFKTSIGLVKKCIDSEYLYQRVRVDDEIKVKSQSVYSKFRYSQDSKWEYDKERVINIISPKEKIIKVNSEKPANYQNILNGRINDAF